MSGVSEALRARLLADWHAWQDDAHLLAFDGFSARCDPDAPLVPGAAEARDRPPASEWLAPPPGTVARPPDLINWVCTVPGPAGTPWEGACLPFVLQFDERYPAQAPKGSFVNGFCHPNVYPSGKVCAPFLNDFVPEGSLLGWHPSVAWAWHPKATVTDVLKAVAALLGLPNNKDAAQDPAWRLLHNSPEEYETCVRTEAQKYTSSLSLCFPATRLTFASDFGNLLESGEWADVTLCCGTARIAAHALILCARSRVFRALLRGPMAADPAAVAVPAEIDEHTLRRTLAFIYTDELVPGFACAEEAQHLLNAADVYALPGLLALCERALVDGMTVENAATTLALADQHGAVRLKRAALYFVARRAAAVMATPGWAHLRTATPLLMETVLQTVLAGAPPELPLSQAADESVEEEVALADQGAEGRRVRQRTAAEHA